MRMLRRSILTFLLCATSCFGAEILFMHQPANLDFDEPLAEFMESLGHSVTFYDTSSGDPDEQAEEAELFDVIFVAESLGSTSTHDGLETYIKEVETPQIWAEAYAWDEAAITGDIQFEDFGNTQRANIDEDPEEEFNEGQDSLYIIDAGHPLAGGFSGKVQVYEELYSLNWGLSSTLGPGAEVVAAVDEAGNYATLFTYEKGALLEDETPAAGKRVGFWLGQAGLGPPIFDNLHANGLALIEAAINYAIGAVGEPGDFDANGQLDVADLDALTAEIAAGTNTGSFDLNADGQVNQGDLNAWVKDLRKTWIGDSNLDGEFNSSDFVLVFTSGKFETGDAASWADGDWNGDGKFDSSDFVSAFTDGGFEQGPLAAQAVPEPSAIGLIALGFICLLCRYRIGH